jgi:hypothetical protein
MPFSPHVDQGEERDIARETELRQLLVLYSAQIWMCSAIQLTAEALQHMEGMYEWHRSLRDFAAQNMSLVIMAATMANFQFCHIVMRRRE